ncbi:hypothetical protein CP973_17570 [Streptomyces albofaciens JCM 4342]|nr:hypothetical protein CP973_17570 [Streptomyces albofaciens JCM 4342]
MSSYTARHVGQRRKCAATPSPGGAAALSPSRATASRHSWRSSRSRYRSVRAWRSMDRACSQLPGSSRRGTPLISAVASGPSRSTTRCHSRHRAAEGSRRNASASRPSSPRGQAAPAAVQARKPGERASAARYERPIAPVRTWSSSSRRAESSSRGTTDALGETSCWSNWSKAWPVSSCVSRGAGMQAAA